MPDPVSNAACRPLHCGRLLVAALIAAQLTGCGLLRPEVNSSTRREDNVPTGERPSGAASQADSGSRLGRPSDIQTIGGMEFVPLEAGTFRMGAQPNAVSDKQTASEFPPHSVSLSRGFLLGRYEVTVGQFRRFVEATGYRTQVERTGTGANSLNLQTGGIQQQPATSWHSPGFAQTDNHPVVCVSWGDATAFCEWMTAQTGQICRLPTEAEWEYACRGGNAARYSTGDAPASLQGYANVRDSAFLTLQPEATAAAPWTDGAQRTAAVGSYRANAWGLHDMHGNVGEWCSDWFDANYYSSTARVDPTGPRQATAWHSVRGGSWFNAAFSCRCSGRHDGIPTAASTTNGFRVLVEGPVIAE
ncbi:MAG: formylglycine-generating enzyme family protein [Planctomycetaceae bacterium]|nr:formylglycine-generating enzyme family protein [Planctomycetaceae bacterium]